MLFSQCQHRTIKGLWLRLHRSLLVSISPKRSLLPPLLEVAADVAEAADDTVEKDTDGLLARTFERLSCLQPILE